MRAARACLAAVLLAACSHSAQHVSDRLTNQRYLSALEVLPAPMRTSQSSAPVMGLVVMGTITNGGSSPLRCSAISFVLIQSSGATAAPSSEFCDVPAIAPRKSASFTARFVMAPQDGLQLRFEHGNGSYEEQQLVVPPA